MRFRPCIDLHEGRVKQIVGSTLRDCDSATLQTNFSSTFPPSHYARMYRRDNLVGGHVIMLGPGNDEAAADALAGWPGSRVSARGELVLPGAGGAEDLGPLTELLAHLAT